MEWVKFEWVKFCLLLHDKLSCLQDLKSIGKFENFPCYLGTEWRHSLKTFTMLNLSFLSDTDIHKNVMYKATGLLYLFICYNAFTIWCQDKPFYKCSMELLFLLLSEWNLNCHPGLWGAWRYLMLNINGVNEMDNICKLMWKSCSSITGKYLLSI